MTFSATSFITHDMVLVYLVVDVAVKGRGEVDCGGFVCQLVGV